MTEPTILIPAEVKAYLQHVRLPEPQSHKGQNGKVLIIGGSELFHAASKWSLDVASSLVDMVFYASVPSNAELVLQAKGEFWNGIVIPLSEIETYAAEADVILIGPGMTRTPDVAEITHHLLATFPTKKWVLDAGALQMVQPEKLPATAIITPHQGELERIQDKLVSGQLRELTARGVTVLLKGPKDTIYWRDQELNIGGGNAGMTKGGTGDVLAGLVAGLYATQTAPVAAVVASFVNKQAGDALFEDCGPFFNASALAEQVPKTLWQCVQAAQEEATS